MNTPTTFSVTKALRFSTHHPQLVQDGKREYYFELFSKIGLILFAILVFALVLGEGAFYNLKRLYDSWKSKQAETHAVLA